MGNKQDWAAAMQRARSASIEAGFTEDARRKERYLYRADFTISSELVELVRLEAANDADGCRVHVEFVGNEEAKGRVLDAIAQLPSVRRSYRMTYEGVEGR